VSSYYIQEIDNMLPFLDINNIVALPHYNLCAKLIVIKEFLYIFGIILVICYKLKVISLFRITYRAAPQKDSPKIGFSAATFLYQMCGSL
jgi:hypothetical protein